MIIEMERRNEKVKNICCFIICLTVKTVSHGKKMPKVGG